MFQRLKRIIKLSKRKPEEIEKLSVELGDEGAEFLGAGTEEEFKQQENDDKGIKGIFGL